MVLEIFYVWLYQCQFPGCDIVLSSCKMLPLGKIGERVHGDHSALFLITSCESIMSETLKFN